MNKEELNRLTERFYRGETTAEEERQLIDSLLAADCPEELLAERHAIISLARPEAIRVPDTLEPRITTALAPGVSRRWLVIAATVLALAGLAAWGVLQTSQQPLLSANTEQAVGNIKTPKETGTETETATKIQTPPTPPPLEGRGAAAPSGGALQHHNHTASHNHSGINNHTVSHNHDELHDRLPEVIMAEEMSDILACIDQLESEMMRGER